MKNAVAVSGPTLPGLLPNVEIRRLAESFAIKPDDANRPTIDRFPTVLEREMLSKRFSDLERALTPISRDLPAPAPDGTPSSDRRIAAMLLGKMFMGWGMTSGRDAADRVSAFLDHLSEQPLFAVEAACRDATSRKLTKPNGDPVDFTYPPSSTVLGAAASRHAADLFFERLKIDKIIYTKRLAPPEPTAAEKQKMQTMLRGVADALRAGAAVESAAETARREGFAREKVERDHRAREAEWRHFGYEPKLNADGSLSSPSTLKLVGRWPVPGAVKIKKTAAR